MRYTTAFALNVAAVYSECRSCGYGFIRSMWLAITQQFDGTFPPGQLSDLAVYYAMHHGIDL